MESGKTNFKDIIVVNCGLEKDLLGEINKSIEKHNIKNGVILSGYGTLSEAVLHMVTTTDYPVKEHFEEMNKPLEIISIDGLIVEGDLHAHITLSDKDQAYGGHLEPGCKVLYLAEIVIGIFEDNIKLKRKENEHGLNLLHIN
ncbi:MAG: PPC domain-containing DNA-binding protein [Candidatus Woesearchaeota archaeon]